MDPLRDPPLLDPPPSHLSSGFWIAVVHAICEVPKGALPRNASRGCRCPTPAPFSVAGVGVPVITQRACAFRAHAIDSLAVMAAAPPIWCPSSSMTRAQCTRSSGESSRENSVLRRFAGISTMSHLDASVAGVKPSNEGNAACADLARRERNEAVARGSAPTPSREDDVRASVSSGDTPKSHRVGVSALPSPEFPTPAAKSPSPAPSASIPPPTTHTLGPSLAPPVTK